MDGVRIDKWLWAARFFRTRSLAARACDLGRVSSNGVKSKPSREVKVGDLVQVRNDAGEFQVEVHGLSEKRGPASVAQALYRETEASRQWRLQLAEDRKNAPRFEGPEGGKPTKRDRRVLNRFRGRI